MRSLSVNLRESADVAATADVTTAAIIAVTLNLLFPTVRTCNDGDGVADLLRRCSHRAVLRKQEQRRC